MAACDKHVEEHVTSMYSYQTLWSKEKAFKTSVASNVKMRDIHIDKDNNIYMLGVFERPFLLKLAADGTQKYIKQSDGAGKYIESDSSGNTYLVAHQSRKRHFYSIKGSLDINLWKLDPSGAVLWKRDYGTDASDIVVDVEIVNNRFIYVAVISQDKILSVSRYSLGGDLLGRGQVTLGGAYYGKITITDDQRKYLYVTDSGQIQSKDIDSIIEVGEWNEDLKNVSRGTSTQLEITERQCFQKLRCAFSKKIYQGNFKFSRFMTITSEMTISSESSIQRSSHDNKTSSASLQRATTAALVREGESGGIVLFPGKEKWLEIQEYNADSNLTRTSRVCLGDDIVNVSRIRAISMDDRGTVIAYSGKKKDGKGFVELGILVKRL